MSQLKLTPEERQDLKDTLGELFHTAFRKGTFGPEAPTIWAAISEMDDRTWGEVLDFVLDGLVPFINDDILASRFLKQPKGDKKSPTIKA